MEEALHLRFVSLLLPVLSPCGTPAVPGRGAGAHGALPLPHRHHQASLQPLGGARGHRSDPLSSGLGNVLALPALRARADAEPFQNSSVNGGACVEGVLRSTSHSPAPHPSRCHIRFPSPCASCMPSPTFLSLPSAPLKHGEGKVRALFNLQNWFYCTPFGGEAFLYPFLLNYL